MSTADDMRQVSNKATAQRESQERAKAIREAQEKESRRLNIMSRSAEIFEPVMKKINEAASAGRTEYRHSYGSYYDYDVWQAEAVAEEAKAHGFKVSFKSEEANMGDSAAPGWTTFHWLEISW